MTDIIAKTVASTYMVCVCNYNLSCTYSGTKKKLYTFFGLKPSLSKWTIKKKCPVDVHPGGYKRRELGDQEEDCELWHSCLSTLSESLFGPELICSNVTWEVVPSSKLLFLEFSRETGVCGFCVHLCVVSSLLAPTLSRRDQTSLPLTARAHWNLSQLDHSMGHKYLRETLR